MTGSIWAPPVSLLVLLYVCFGLVDRSEAKTDVLDILYGDLPVVVASSLQVSWSFAG